MMTPWQGWFKHGGPKRRVGRPRQTPACQGAGWIVARNYGLIAAHGDVELILRLYDRADGGTKLFEETALVEVSQGTYLAFVAVPSRILAGQTTVWMEVARETRTSLRIAERQAFALKRADNQVLATSCPSGGCASLCYTCGGDYPFYNGTIALPSGSMPTERGGSCAQPLEAMADVSPFLCTQ
jgi:hypothetical protein